MLVWTNGVVVEGERWKGREDVERGVKERVERLVGEEVEQRGRGGGWMWRGRLGRCDGG